MWISDPDITTQLKYPIAIENAIGFIEYILKGGGKNVLTEKEVSITI